MNKNLIIVGMTAVMCLKTPSAHAQKSTIPTAYYNSTTIPENLKKNANYVTRYYHTETDVKGPEKASVKFHIIKTLLNEKAEKEAWLMLGYDKMINVNSPTMVVYDATGNQLKRYKKNDMYDRSAIDGVSLVSDDRVLLLRHTVVTYPVTVEISYEYNYTSGYLDLADWRIQDPENSVEESVCIVRVNPKMGFRFKAKNTSVSPQKSTDDGKEVYTWTVKNLEAIKPEIGSKIAQVLPKVTFATNNVIFGGIPADFSTWKGFGIWQQQLNRGMTDLPPARVEELKKMVSGLSTNKEKAKFLYEYMQKSVRYVGIQLGIGGWRPFPATFVDQKKYGDCKGLSNYMQALLKAVDIPSYYAIVRAGANEEGADEDFVNSPFNHIILCVPFEKDSTWLECTSNISTFGKLGSFTENRNALLITEEGGKLVNTPSSNMHDHALNSIVDINIQDDGMAKAKMDIFVSGEFRNDYIRLMYKKTDDQKKEISTNLNLKQPDSFQLAEKEDKEGTKQIELNLEYEKLQEFAAGNKLFLKPGIIDLWKYTFPITESRKSDFFFEHPGITTNKTTFRLPGTMELESAPPNTSLKFSYGTYTTNYLYDKEKNEIVVDSRFELHKHVIPASKYTEMQVFMDGIAKSMSKKLIIKKKV